MFLHMEYSEVRGAWEVVSDDGEWIFEGTYEQCEKMVDSTNASLLEDGYF